MLLHVPWAPVLSIGHVVLSPAVHICVHTLKFDIVYVWHIIDVHCELLVHGS
jgi:hypothetical protein